MRKHLSRVMAVLLVLAMALTMLPVVSAAKERFTATPIDGIPESGQSFVIYSAPAGGVFSPEAPAAQSAFRLLSAPRSLQT